MRVLYFTEGDSPHDRRFLSALGDTSHHIFALRRTSCTPKTPSGVTELRWPQGNVDWSSWYGWESGISQFKHILARVRPDILHAGPVQGPALLAAMAGFHPLLTMSWGSDLLLQANRSPWMRYATQFALAHTDLFLADCQTVADEAQRYGFLAENIVQFPWGVDLNHFSMENGLEDGLALRRTLGWDDQFVILCNRTWSALYGVDVLANAFANAVHFNQNLRLLLVGDGPQRDLIRQRLEPLGKTVHYPGWIDIEALPGAYCAADLFVSPSHCDGSSISLLEAMACSRPVLVSDIPSNREWVRPGVNGGLFHDGEVGSLKDKLLDMPAESGLHQFGIRSREIAEEKANWNENFNKLLRAYQSAVKQVVK
mgnify:CR=1 FL=1